MYPTSDVVDGAENPVSEPWGAFFSPATAKTERRLRPLCESNPPARMPYHADLRCSFVDVRLNINWFYQLMDDLELVIDYLPSPNATGDEETRCDWSKTRFERHIEQSVDKWIEDCVFSPRREENIKACGCDNVWDYMRECAEDYANDHPTEVTITARDTE